MSVAKLKKLSIAGSLLDKDALLQGLQEHGVMHLNSLATPQKHVEEAVDRHAEGAYKALHFLAVVPKPRRQVRETESFDVHAFVADVLKVRRLLRSARDRRDFLRNRIDTVRPWGAFSLPDHTALAGQKLWFYKLPIKQRTALETVQLPWVVVGEDATSLFVIVISPTEPERDLLPVSREHVGSKSISALETELDAIEIEIESIQSERHAMTRYLTLLRTDISKAETAAELSFARSQTRDDDALFAVQGWVPIENIADVENLCTEKGVAVLVEEPQWDETPPTLLKQPETQSAGVNLSMFYQVPSYRGWDPTILLVASFALFFAMIIADAGYGVVLFVLIGLFWRRLGRTQKLRSWRGLGLILATSTLIYGVIVGSYFGATLPEENALSYLAFLDLNDFDTMMRVSIVVGVLHIAFANFMAFRSTEKRSGRANLAWIGILFGSLTVWLTGMSGPFFIFGATLAAIGAIGLVFYSSDRPIEKSSDWAWRIFDGVKKLSGLMSMFGDVLSYMRLFALGLASASLALTFNDLAGDVMASRSGFAIVGGLLILLIGHVLNFGLAVMSGVVHGLRLNYIEFYKWGLPEEGIPFKAFSVKEVQK